MLIPLLANDATRLKNLGFIKAELESPEKTNPPSPDKPIPPPPADSPGLNIHKVITGDTYAKIARAYGLTVKELKDINNINGEPLTEFTALKTK
jgi:LysM repeat protein